MTERYIPALGFKALTPIYDLVVRFTTRESTVKRALVEAACDGRVDTVVDVGCGTGTLAILIKQRLSGARVIGVDMDEQMLGYAQRKAEKAGTTIEFVRANATNLPLADNVADRVVSSLFFHHLQPQQKRQALSQAFRILSPGGQLYVADWGRGSNVLMRALFVLIRLLDGFSNTADHAHGRLPALIREAGAEQVESLGNVSTVFGTMNLLRATKPSHAA